MVDPIHGTRAVIPGRRGSLSSYWMRANGPFWLDLRTRGWWLGHNSGGELSPSDALINANEPAKPATKQSMEVTSHAQLDSRGGSRRGAGLAGSGPGATAYRDQVQPRRGAGHPQGQGRGQVQGA